METLSYSQLMERMLAAEARVVELESGEIGNALPERENHHVEVVGKLMERITELESRTVRLPKIHSATEFLFPVAVYSVQELTATLTRYGIKWETK